jgi:hypothetical protein
MRLTKIAADAGSVVAIGEMLIESLRVLTLRLVTAHSREGLELGFC